MEALRRAAAQFTPVVAECVKQLMAEHDVAVAVALAAMDMNHHPPAVDIADLQMGYFCAACAGAVEGHQDCAMKGTVGGVDKTCHFVRGKNQRKTNYLLGIRCLGND